MFFFSSYISCEEKSMPRVDVFGRVNVLKEIDERKKERENYLRTKIISFFLCLQSVRKVR
jgi:hypothetical protein